MSPLAGCGRTDVNVVIPSGARNLALKTRAVRDSSLRSLENHPSLSFPRRGEPLLVERGPRLRGGDRDGGIFISFGGPQAHEAFGMTG